MYVVTHIDKRCLSSDFCSSVKVFWIFWMFCVFCIFLTNLSIRARASSYNQWVDIANCRYQYTLHRGLPNKPAPLWHQRYRTVLIRFRRETITNGRIRGVNSIYIYIKKVYAYQIIIDLPASNATFSKSAEKNNAFVVLSCKRNSKRHLAILRAICEKIATKCSIHHSVPIIDP